MEPRGDRRGSGNRECPTPGRQNRAVALSHQRWPFETARECALDRGPHPRRRRPRSSSFPWSTPSVPNRRPRTAPRRPWSRSDRLTS